MILALYITMIDPKGSQAELRILFWMLGQKILHDFIENVTTTVNILGFLS